MQDTQDITGAGYKYNDSIPWKPVILFLYSKKIHHRSTTVA